MNPRPSSHSGPVYCPANVDYSSFDDRRIKHLEMIQAVVARLGNNAFFIKGWTITIAGVFLGFAVNQDKWQLAVASAAPTLLFWILDASFLRNERLFRDLYDRVRKGEIEPFFMGATSPKYIEGLKNESREKQKPNTSSRFRTFWRLTLLLFYGAVLIAAFVIAIVLCRT